MGIHDLLKHITHAEEFYGDSLQRIKCEDGKAGQHTFRKQAVKLTLDSCTETEDVVFDAEGLVYQFPGSAYHAFKAPVKTVVADMVKNKIEPLFSMASKRVVIVFDDGSTTPKLKSAEQLRRDTSRKSTNKGVFADVKTTHVTKLDPEQTLADHLGLKEDSGISPSVIYGKVIESREIRREFKSLLIEAVVSACTKWGASTGLKVVIRTNDTKRNLIFITPRQQEHTVLSRKDGAKILGNGVVPLGEAELYCFQIANTGSDYEKVTILSADTDAIAIATNMAYLRVKELNVVVSSAANAVALSVHRLFDLHTTAERQAMVTAFSLLGTDYVERRKLAILASRHSKTVFGLVPALVESVRVKPRGVDRDTLVRVLCTMMNKNTDPIAVKAAWVNRIVFQVNYWALPCWPVTPDDPLREIESFTDDETLLLMVHPSYAGEPAPKTKKTPAAATDEAAKKTGKPAKKKAKVASATATGFWPSAAGDEHWDSD